MINSFSGEHRWLSNFWPAVVVLDGVAYPSVENAYQASKFDIHKRQQFVTCTAAEAKKFGKILGNPPLEWQAVKTHLMAAFVAEKFKPGSELAQKLLATGDQELIEGNWWGDTFWGVCRGKGENHLGKILMEQRRKIQHEQSQVHTNVQQAPPHAN